MTRTSPHASTGALHDIICVRSPWDEFWEHWARLPVELDRKQLITAWYIAVNEAVEEVEGGALGSLDRSLAKPKASQTPASVRALAKYLAAAGVQAGETGQSRLIDGSSPRQIELALRDRLMSDAIPLPKISKRYDPRVSLT